MSMPGLDEIPEECGWTLGFRHGGHCGEAREPGEEFCRPHVKADRRIDKYARRAALQAERDLGGYFGSIADLHVLRDPRAIAERWWVSSGVRQIPAEVRRDVLDSKACAYCGCKKVDEIDHIFPVSRGGTSERSNLAPACFRCNREKLDLTVEEWREWRTANGLSWPPKTIAQLARDLLKRLVKEDPPPPFLADLVNMPAPEVLSDWYKDDPRWQTAMRALNGEDGPWTPEADLLRRTHAVEVVCEIETAYGLFDSEEES